MNDPIPDTHESRTMISVALVTRNRPESLERTLSSLRGQEQQPYEVVVSDDSNEESRQDVLRVSRKYDCQYLEGPRRGLYANRNHVALACRGTHIRTMDDDHEFPPRHWAACEDAVHSDPSAVWIVGEFLPSEQHRPLPPPTPGQLNARGFSTCPSNSQDSWALADGASIFPRYIFDRGERYYEGFKFGAAYLEFGARLHWLGYRIRLLEDSYVIHHYDEGSRSYIDKGLDLASRVFAMACHSRIYRPTLRNRLLTEAQLLRHRLSGPPTRLSDLQRGLEAYRQRRKHSSAKVN